METCNTRKRARSEPEIEGLWGPVHGHPVASPPKRRRASHSTPALHLYRRSSRQQLVNKSSSSSSTDHSHDEELAESFKHLSLEEDSHRPPNLGSPFDEHIWETPHLSPFKDERYAGSWKGDASPSPSPSPRRPRRYPQRVREKMLRGPPVVRKDLDLSEKSAEVKEGEGGSVGLTKVRFFGTSKGWTYEYEGMDQDLLEWEQMITGTRHDESEEAKSV